MPIDLLTQKIDIGDVDFEWDFPEYIKHERSPFWYLGATLTVVGLLIFSLATANVLFAAIIIIATIIILFLGRKEPRIMTMKITDEGIVIENRFYPYNEIKNFWVVHELPNVKRLYFEFKSVFIPRLSVPYGEQDPNRLKSYLLQYIEENEDREGEPVSEGFGRWLKL